MAVPCCVIACTNTFDKDNPTSLLPCPQETRITKKTLDIGNQARSMRIMTAAGSLLRWTPPHTEHTKEGGCRWSAQRGPTAGPRCRWKHNGDPPPDDAADGSTMRTHRRTTLQMEAQRGPTTGWSRDV
ncbi:uncharacterized protein LOC111135815 [Crassostrea virginica]